MQLGMADTHAGRHEHLQSDQETQEHSKHLVNHDKRVWFLETRYLKIIQFGI
jgi:hypothetical protein